MEIIDGKKISQEIKEELREKAAEQKSRGEERCLAVIQVGSDPASTVYVRNKKKACEYIGIKSISYELPEETGEEELLEIIRGLNEREDVNGILVQLPLPEHINEERVLSTIAPKKDEGQYFICHQADASGYGGSGGRVLSGGRRAGPYVYGQPGHCGLWHPVFAGAVSCTAFDLYGFFGSGRVPGSGNGKECVDFCHYEEDYTGDSGIVYSQCLVPALWIALCPAFGGAGSGCRIGDYAEEDFSEESGYPSNYLRVWRMTYV